MKRNATRTYIGNAPSNGTLIGEHDGWQLYERSRSYGWLNMKLISVVTRTGKANYYIGHNGERYAAGNDARLLAHALPLVHAWVESVARARAHAHEADEGQV